MTVTPKRPAPANAGSSPTGTRPEQRWSTSGAPSSGALHGGRGSDGAGRGAASGRAERAAERVTEIAAISPNALLGSFCTSLLGLIEDHTLSVPPTVEQPLAEYIAQRLELHRALVDALEQRDRDEALRLIHEHNTSPAAQH